MESNTKKIDYYSLSNDDATLIGNITFSMNVQGFLVYGQYLVVYEQYDVKRINVSDLLDVQIVGSTGGNNLGCSDLQ